MVEDADILDKTPQRESHIAVCPSHLAANHRSTDVCSVPADAAVNDAHAVVAGWTCLVLLSVSMLKLQGITRRFTSIVLCQCHGASDGVYASTAHGCSTVVAGSHAFRSPFF